MHFYSQFISAVKINCKEIDFSHFLLYKHWTIINHFRGMIKLCLAKRVSW